MPPFDPAEAARYPAAIGCDEVGRGALCGPVVVAAVWFDPAALPPTCWRGSTTASGCPKPCEPCSHP